MTAPTRQEIRLAVIRTWNEEDVESVLEDAFAFQLGTAAQMRVWDVDWERDDSPSPDEAIDLALRPLLAEIRERSLEAIATALEGFAAEHPDLHKRRVIGSA